MEHQGSVVWAVMMITITHVGPFITTFLSFLFAFLPPPHPKESWVIWRLRSLPCPVSSWWKEQTAFTRPEIHYSVADWSGEDLAASLAASASLSLTGWWHFNVMGFVSMARLSEKLAHCSRVPSPVKQGHLSNTTYPVGNDRATIWAQNKHGLPSRWLLARLYRVTGAGEKLKERCEAFVLKKQWALSESDLLESFFFFFFLNGVRNASHVWRSNET